MNGTLREATAQRDHDGNHDERRGHLHLFLDATTTPGASRS
jgi:hypothetical protein